MNLRDLIHECHRRSLWQVLGIYVVVSWCVFEVVQTLTEGLGLPDWFPGFAFALLLIGLPIVMATAFVQEGGPASVSPAAGTSPTEDGSSPPSQDDGRAPRSLESPPSLGRQRFTLRNAIQGGLAVFALLGVVATGWLLIADRRGETVQSGGASPIRSVAVLPFTNMSADPDNEYFAEGLAEELLNVLAQVEELKVPARMSAFAFDGQSTDVREIGEILGVEAVVEGSVRKQRDRVRITVQLVQVEDGFQLWSDTYEGDLADVFALQDSVAQAIADELQVTLGIEGRSRRERGLTDDLDAYELYLLGRQQFAQRSEAETLRRSREHYERAIEADPEFALAWSGLADAYLLTPHYDLAADRSLSHARARNAVGRALELSPGEPQVQATAGYVALIADWDFGRAREHLNRAVALGPSYVWGYHYRGVFFMTRGRYSPALRDGRAALELDPLSPVVAYNIAADLRALDSLEVALPLFRQAAASARPPPHWLLDHAFILCMLGPVDEAREVMNEWARALGYPQAERVGAHWAAYPLCGHADRNYFDAWNEDGAVRVWAATWRSLLDDIVATAPIDGVQLEYASAFAGPEAFLDAAEVMVEEQSVWALFLNHPEFYRGLQEEPRYQALLARVGLPPPEGF